MHICEHTCNIHQLRKAPMCVYHTGLDSVVCDWKQRYPCPKRDSLFFSHMKRTLEAASPGLITAGLLSLKLTAPVPHQKCEQMLLWDTNRSCDKNDPVRCLNYTFQVSSQPAGSGNWPEHLHIICPRAMDYRRIFNWPLTIVAVYWWLWGLRTFPFLWRLFNRK